MEMIMKNVLVALALLGGVALAGSANAAPAASLAGIGERASPTAEKVHFRYFGHRYFGHRFFFNTYGYGYGYGYDYWKNYCYYHPYHWKCRAFGY
jgi:hypothetical protein